MKKTWILMVTILCLTVVFGEGFSMDIDMGADGAAIKVSSEVDAKVKTETSRTSTEENDNFKIKYVQTDNGSTSLKILAPQGAFAKVYTEQNTKIHSAAIPTRVSLQGNDYYIVKVTADGNEAKLKIEAKKGMEASLWIKTFSSASAGISVKVSIEDDSKPSSLSGCELSSDDFAELVAQINDEDFSDDKLDILDTVTKANCFSVDQAVKLIKLFEYDDDKIEAAKKLYPTLIDNNRSFKLSSCFEYSSSKEEFKEWVGQQ